MSDALSAAVVQLHEAGIPDPSNEARKLEALATEQGVDLAKLVARRATHEPFSHIAGRRAFWNYDFYVSADVLDPRPDTEALVEAALSLPFDRVLDLGTGSGCILCSLLAERPSTTGVGADISAKALRVAERNAQITGTIEQVEWIESNWFEAIEGRFDLITSNPPYITEMAYSELDPTVQRFEPRIALTPGGDGLAPYRLIAEQGGAYLMADGYVLLEIGFDQRSEVQSIFAAKGWRGVSCIPDLNGKDRVIRAKAPVSR